MKQRSIGMMILLSIITFGIYLVYWYIVFQAELKEKTGEGSGVLLHVLLSLVTLGIYYIYWQYAAGKRLAKQGANDLSIIYLVLTFTPASLINPFLMQSQANQIN